MPININLPAWTEHARPVASILDLQ